jgi:hypothetical protein
MVKRRKPDHARVDEENPEWTAEDFRLGQARRRGAAGDFPAGDGRRAGRNEDR